MTSQVVLISCLSLMASKVEHFLCLSAIRTSSFEKCLIWFLISWFFEFFLLCQILILCQMVRPAKIFSHSVGHLLIVSFPVQKLLSSMKSHLPIVGVIYSAMNVLVRKCLLTATSWSISPTSLPLTVPAFQVKLH